MNKFKEIGQRVSLNMNKETYQLVKSFLEEYKKLIGKRRVRDYDEEFRYQLNELALERYANPNKRQEIQLETIPSLDTDIRPR